ncbi:MAG: tRNA (adenosine(37)-N6)-threonylcarbamoyltransferase complex ATPase subunit type 1 TsaE, partial [Anaerolineaceae bacterium]|nr:tRNA (adenosine(37)-N6)-threonylcarbamoyltransferase complex ATPase subunit type 1 TsaE [Anaerolineaceae bacterium]
MTILEPNSVEFISHSADQTRRVGMRLGAMLRKGNLLCLTGNLGAGKTTFVQGLASGWGSLEQVTSPTFVLINQYRPLNGDGLIYHLDAYRLQSGFEAEELDLDTMLDTGILIIEWPERIV